MINLRRALRMLFRAPFVTIVAIASLALGIGANAATFSLFDQMLLRPWPAHPQPSAVADAHRVARTPSRGRTTCRDSHRRGQGGRS